MAEQKQPEKKEKDKAAASEVTADSGKARKKKLILIGAAVAVLLIGAAAGWFMLSGKKEAAKEGESAASEEKHEPAVAIYESLGDKFVVTLQHEGQQHYLQLSLSVLTRETEVGEALKVHAPLIRGKLVSLLGSQDFAALRTEAGKLALRERILKSIQEILQAETGKPGIEQVFYTEFVLQ